MLACLNATLSLKSLAKEAAVTQMKKMKQAAEHIEANLNELNQLTLFIWTFIGPLGQAKTADEGGLLSQSWAEEWQLYKTAAAVLEQMGYSEAEIAHAMQALRLISEQQNWYDRLGKLPLSEIAKSWFSSPEILAFLQVNRFEDILWYNREAFNDFLWWMNVIAVLNCEMKPSCTRSDTAEALLGCNVLLQQLLKADQSSEFQLEKLIEAIRE
jgi:tetratricopeptide (TPR) repeat protein